MKEEGLSKRRVKNNFTEWWKKQRKRIKPFHSETENICLEETQAIQRTSKGSSSEEEHKVNALASGAEEGRDKLR